MLRSRIHSIAVLLRAGLSAVFGRISVQSLKFTGEILAHTTTNQNDWAITGFAAAGIVRMTNTGGVNVTGIDATGAEHGDMKLLIIEGSGSFSFLTASASSLEANRFASPTKNVAAGSCVILVRDATYNGNVGAWRFVA